MKKHRASKRYANALFELCKEEKVVDTVSENMAMIGDTMESNPDLIAVLESPNVTKKDKNQILQQLFKISKEEVHPVVNKLLQLLLNKNREMLIPEIAEWFLELEDEYKNILRAELITAVPIGKKHKEKLTKSIEEKTKKKVVFEEKTDKTIIGGFVIKMADKVIDASISSGLKKIQNQLTIADFS